jgi:hypothetical protein
VPLQAEELFGVAVSDFVCLVFGEGKAFQEFAGAVEAEVGVVD